MLFPHASGANFDAIVAFDPAATLEDPTRTYLQVTNGAFAGRYIPLATAGIAADIHADVAATAAPTIPTPAPTPRAGTAGARDRATRDRASRGERCAGRGDSRGPAPGMGPDRRIARRIELPPAKAVGSSVATKDPRGRGVGYGDMEFEVSAVIGGPPGRSRRAVVAVFIGLAAVAGIAVTNAGPARVATNPAETSGSPPSRPPGRPTLRPSLGPSHPT